MNAADTLVALQEKIREETFGLRRGSSAMVRGVRNAVNGCYAEGMFLAPPGWDGPLRVTLHLPNAPDDAPVVAMLELKPYKGGDRG